MNEIIFKCVGCLTMFLYAATMDKFMFIEILGIKRIPVRMALFGLSILAVCSIVRYKYGIVWIAFNAGFVALMSPIAKKQNSKAKRIEDY
jgi:hypothetical protein